MRAWFEMPQKKTSDPELVRLYQQHLVLLQQQIDATNPLRVRLHRLSYAARTFRHWTSRHANSA